MRSWIVCALLAVAGGCAHSRPAPPVAADPNLRCTHGVACETCVKCHPELAEKFRAAGDWCPEHGVPESQCAICHPEVVRAAPRAPSGADVQKLVEGGRDVDALEPLVVPGKVTIFDFYADWCGPCREVDAHVFQLLAARSDLAYRKLDIVSWDSPLARHHLVAARVPNLPYVVVYAKNGRRVRAISGLDLAALDRAVEEAAR
ncbi:MAG: Cobalt/zinc/cadmium efflux transporter, rane fusion protein CzcB family [Myxococcales bacterium]|nr:Cobalt/zinc/cadmium efflux transporter, rane fusion protein CzcB family [Myxococcales bacterium]